MGELRKRYRTAESSAHAAAVTLLFGREIARMSKEEAFDAALTGITPQTTEIRAGSSDLETN